MEVLSTSKYYILNSGQDSLWFDKKTGTYEAKTCWDLASAENPTCLGLFHLLLGKIQIHQDLPPRLLLVSGVRDVGIFCGGVVSCITKVQIIPPIENTDLNLQPCHKHLNFNPGSGEKKLGVALSDIQQKMALPVSKTFGTIRNVTSSIKTATINATGQGSKTRKESRDRERYEKRILDEIQKMFTDSDSFYYSSEVDLTTSIQQKHCPDKEHSTGQELADNPEEEHSTRQGLADAPIYLKADQDFFWNYYMLKDLIDREDSRLSGWIVPVIQGYVQIENIPLYQHNNELNNQQVKPKDYYSLTLISRRSRHRAGTRYKRRGVDDEGYVANYVQTEQIVSLNHHKVAFIQVRGSVPVYWSQPGYKYRPPPRLDRDESETSVAFQKHFEREISNYKHVNCVSLCEVSGKERVISDAFLNHILDLDSEHLTFVTFDFHEYCRGMRYENVSMLLEGLEEIINMMLYCWVDREGVICKQNGVFRINCIDCLDRTNLVQTSIAKCVLENQFVKLGMIGPEHPLPDTCRALLQVMWANNGDIISKQYAGTSALKGDFTRTGERRFSGMMKDGMNSANRYYMSHFIDTYRQIAIDVMQGISVNHEVYLKLSSIHTAMNIADELIPINPPQYMAEVAPYPETHLVSAAYSLSRYYMNRFKDAYRQATIDHLLGNPITEDLMNPDQSSIADEECGLTAIHVKHVIDDCKKLLVPDADNILGAWGLINADIFNGGDTEQTDMDTIVILTREAYFIAQYDDELDEIINFDKIQLIDIENIELGPFTIQSSIMFKNSKTFPVIRINYKDDGVPGFFHCFRSMNIRFFNNMALPIKCQDETMECIKSIGETFQIACQMLGSDVVINEGPITKKRSLSRAHPSRNTTMSGIFAPISPDTFKNAVQTGLARLNPLTMKTKKPEPQDSSKFYLEKPRVQIQDDTPVQCNRIPLYMESCGILESYVHTETYTHKYVHRSLSDSALNTNLNPNRSATPEIVVSGIESKLHGPQSSVGGSQSSIGGTPSPLGAIRGLSPSLLMQRVRKISHSSDEVDSRDEGGLVSSSSLSLHLPSSHSDTQIAPNLDKFSPLTSMNKEIMLAPFCTLLKGVQTKAKSLGGEAEKLARGMKTISTKLDSARRLNWSQRQKPDEDPVLVQRKANCRTKIIQI